MGTIVPFRTKRSKTGPLRCDPVNEVDNFMWRSMAKAETVGEAEPTNKALAEHGGIIHAYLLYWKNRQVLEAHAVWDALPLPAYRELMAVCYLTGSERAGDLALLNPSLLLLDPLRQTEQRDEFIPLGPDQRTPVFVPSSFVVCLLSPPGDDSGTHRTLFTSPVSVRGRTFLLRRLAPFDVLDWGDWERALAGTQEGIPPGRP